MATRKTKNELVLPEDPAPGTSIVGETDKDGNKLVNFIPVFPILTGSVRLPEIDLQAMARKTLELVGDRVNYEGGWTSYFAPQTDIRVIPGMDDLAQAALGVSAAMARELKMDVQPEKSILQMWVSVIRKGGHHGIHAHARSTFSGTFYVQCDERSAPLMLMNPTRSLRHHEPRPSRAEDFGPFTSEQFTIKPEPGMMNVWPSWMEHHVLRHDDDRPRISVSFNVDYPDERK